MATSTYQECTVNNVMKKAKIQTFHWMQSSNIAMKSRVKK